ncbi:unnamed protein product [Leptosia nina]|uniref:Uncharacterized protein n=1 Tax=Leptosia nina TaxID=320188 RepID=A0AAV1J821_9NEOP
MRKEKDGHVKLESSVSEKPVLVKAELVWTQCSEVGDLAFCITNRIGGNGSLLRLLFYFRLNSVDNQFDYLFLSHCYSIGHIVLLILSF